ncbi:transposase [Thiorhodococcus minor]|uniref:Uncharacterized protein n=1 Tax=Thiorhodococcus minor TaxID=57489 RepID=A0A6M0K855_9GAMM|nr:transposase [Thiorhodococcus minor]NEV64867.1 hypothetical protein [Thiorhodococcus minor]
MGERLAIARRSANAHRLPTCAGKASYAERNSAVATIIGIIKNVLGFRKFLLRGLHAVSRTGSLTLNFENGARGSRALKIRR